jgi:O-succinylbenzoate synthase
MRIEAIDIRHISLPLVHPFETSFGREEVRQLVLVSAHGGGLTGWGEAATSAAPWYEYETVETCLHVLTRFLAPRVVGQEVASAEDVARLMAPIRGHNIAKMGLEAAVWDLLGQAEGKSVSQLLGGTRDRVPVGVSIGIQPTVEDLLARIADFWQQGYARIKIKIRPGWDVEVVHQVRQALPRAPVMVDANSAYTLADADHLAGLDDHNLLMIEQPLAHDDLVDHAALQARLRTDICLDESVPSLAAARSALAMGSGRIINIKPGRVGGLTVARAIHDLCLERGIGVWCGGMLETGIGRAHNVALASLPGFSLPGDISGSARYYHQDLVEPAFVPNDDSTMTVPTAPGIGVEVIQARVDAATQRSERISI